MSFILICSKCDASTTVSNKMAYSNDNIKVETEGYGGEVCIICSVCDNEVSDND